MIVTIPPKREAFSTVFLAIWLIFWIFGGIIALLTLIWKVIGKEYVAITTHELVVSRSLPF